MPLLFDKNNITIDFISKPLENNDKYKSKTIVLPALRWKIYAPVIEELKLNIFQKTVLSILNKGNYSISEIANWLNLDFQLIQMVITELNQEGYLNNGVITDKGRALIEDTFSWFNNAKDIKKDIYYIYQDVYTQELYPSIVKFDPTSNSYDYKDNKIQKSSDESIYVNFIEPRGVKLDKIKIPDINEIFEALQKESKIINNESSKMPSNLIQLLDNEPTLSFLATIIYTHKDETDVDNFKVLDPFQNEDVAFWLKDNLMTSSKNNQYIFNLINSLVEDAKNIKKEQFSEALKEIHKEAKQKMENTFDDSLKQYDKLYKALEDFYKDIHQYEYEKNGKYLKEAFKNSQTVLETLFDYIYKLNPEGYQTVLKADKTLYQVDIDIINKKILKINPDIKLPEWRVRYIKNLQYAMKNKAMSLRPAYIAAILASYYDRNNMMVSLINSKNDLIIFLEKVTNARNSVGHQYKDIQEHQIGEYFNEAIEIQDGIEEIVTIFLKGNENGKS